MMQFKYTVGNNLSIIDPDARYIVLNTSNLKDLRSKISLRLANMEILRRRGSAIPTQFLYMDIKLDGEVYSSVRNIDSLYTNHEIHDIITGILIQTRDLHVNRWGL